MLFMLLTATASLGQQNAANDITPLSACNCADVPRLQDRLQKLKGVELLIANQLQSTSSTNPATQHEWNTLQNQIRGYLQAMQIQGLSTFPDTNLFNDNADPFCSSQGNSAGACLDQDFTVHQTGHDASCRIGKWNWQVSWTQKDMLLEEGTAIQKEMQTIQETIKQLGCGLQPSVTGTTTPAQPTSPNRAGGPCPQFMVVVQRYTTSSINIPGALTEQSNSSLNGGQGIPIPLVFNSDGSFQGFGSGTESGTAMGAQPNETVGGQFGHTRSVGASGFIRPGSCATRPCQPDVMHLVLASGPSQQMIQMQARGVLNRDLNQATATDAAQVEFDLPAYVGGSGQKIFFATPILQSGMSVNLVQGNNGTPALPVGSSLLYSMQQCKVGGTGNVNTAGGGGAAGVVIPGLEGVSSTPTRIPAPGIQNKGGTGIMIPGWEGNPPPMTNNGGNTNMASSPIVIHVDEKINVTDSPAHTNSTVVAVNETVHVGDTVTPTPGALVDVHETIHVSDDLGKTQSTIINVMETIQLGDSPVASAAAAATGTLPAKGAAPKK